MDSSQFRQTMGRFATGVAIITITDAAGAPHGMTVNSLTSVSLEPPLLLVCLDHAASLRDDLLASGEFAVSVLEQHQEDLSRRFAKAHDDRFAGVGYHAGQGSAPLLDGALAHLECRVSQVLAATVHDGRPLCYYRGGYASLA
jgi:flavin reductase (DIM6/NTAB) family NADH-FMN oxidoreductase RutF